jgi:hypothetical protein
MTHDERLFMFSSQREKRAAVPHVVALVEFDMQKMRVRFFLAREAIRERMLELEHPRSHEAKLTGSA